MKQFLCFKNNKSWYRDFKLGKIYTEDDQGIIEDCGGCDWCVDVLLKDGIIKPIETLERDGVEWILIRGEKENPVNPEWHIHVVDSDYQLVASGTHIQDPFYFVRAHAIRIISTGEQEDSGSGGGIDPEIMTISGIEDDSVMRITSATIGGTPVMHEQKGESIIVHGYDANFNAVTETFESPYYLFEDDSEAYDWREPSPQEAAYAEKVAAMQPEPDQVKTFPASALRDMTDKTFANLLGMGQFIGGGEWDV